MTRLALAGAAALVLGAAPLAADTSQPGFALAEQPLPGGYSFDGLVTCTLPGGDVVRYDGTNVERYDPAGGFVMSLGSTATNFAAWILPAPDGTAVVFAHSGSFPGPGGELYRAELDGSGVSLVTTLFYSYDAAFLSDTELIVTADATAGASQTDLIHVDLTTGVKTPRGQLAFPSGALAVNAAGDLYYADLELGGGAGTCDILRWTAAEVANGTVLDYTSADVWGAGYDPVSSMRFDPVGGKLFVAENVYDPYFNLLSARIRRARPNVANAEEVLVADAAISNLEFVNSGGGSASFQSYQPANGSNLKYNTNDFFQAVANHSRLDPARPVLTASGPGTLGVGAVTLDVAGAPPGGTIYLIFAPQGSMSPTEQTYKHPGYLYHTRFWTAAIRRTPFLLPVDASGNGSFTLWNPGTLNGVYGYQYLVGDPSGTFLGSSTQALF